MKEPTFFFKLMVVSIAMIGFPFGLLFAGLRVGFTLGYNFVIRGVAAEDPEKKQ